MKLRELIEVMPDDRQLYIGSASNFLFIGTKAEYLKSEEWLSAWYYTRSKENLKRYQRELDTILNARTLKLYRLKQKKTCEQSIERLNNYLKEYIPLDEREVLDKYLRIQGGIAIIVEGSDCGRFWTKEEYQEFMENIRCKDK